jgi:hypothetical protein
MAGGLLCTIVVLQFAHVIPWAGDEATYIGGRWTGVVLYLFTAGFFFAAGYAWLTVKPWASMVTILAALIGFFVPFISHMDGTDPRSSAIAPLVVSVLMLIMVFKPSTNRAMAVAMTGQGGVKVAKAPPPPKPMSAARKREVAQEQARAAKAAAAKPAAPAVATAATPAMATAASAPASVAAPAVATPAQTATKTAASMVLSAASSLKSAAATPASPRKGVTVGVPRQTFPAQSAAAAPSPAPPTQPGRPRGFRADEV